MVNLVYVTHRRKNMVVAESKIKYNLFLQYNIDTVSLFTSAFYICTILHPQ